MKKDYILENLNIFLSPWSQYNGGKKLYARFINTDTKCTFDIEVYKICDGKYSWVVTIPNLSHLSLDEYTHKMHNEKSLRAFSEKYHVKCGADEGEYLCLIFITSLKQGDDLITTFDEISLFLLTDYFDAIASANSY